MAAINQNYLALEYASNEMRNDRDIIMAAVQSDKRALGSILNYIGEDIKADSKFIRSLHDIE